MAPLVVYRGKGLLGLQVHVYPSIVRMIVRRLVVPGVIMVMGPMLAAVIVVTNHIAAMIRSEHFTEAICCAELGQPLWQITWPAVPVAKWGCSSGHPQGMHFS